MKNNLIQKIAGFALLALVLGVGAAVLPKDMLFFRLLVGLGLGYTLSRAYMGFAGSVNRAYNTGSTKLMRTLMFMFVISAIMTAAFLLFKNPADFGLWVNPINMGLIAGGLLFGFGMTFSSCCASGVLTDLVGEFPKAFVTLVFFCFGVFIGFPIQNSAPWVKETWFSTASYSGKGVYLPDIFGGDRLGGYLGAIVLTLIFAGIVVALSYAYEKKRHKLGTFGSVPSEVLQEETQGIDSREFKLLSAQTYHATFVKPWSLTTGAVIISVIFVLLMGVTGSGWGASTPYGLWFGKFLMLFGVSPEALASFAGQKVAFYASPLIQNGVTVQNVAIVLGAFVYLLSSGYFADTVRGVWKLKIWQVALFAMGGFLMGFGTRLSNGCNVGALYTPIANFSLSGWIFFVVLVIGGILGNKVQSYIFSKVKR